jgi:hypothetical protein
MQLARRETWHCQSGTIGIALDPPWNPSTRLFVLWGFGGKTPDEQRETNDHGPRELAITLMLDRSRNSGRLGLENIHVIGAPSSLTTREPDI